MSAFREKGFASLPRLGGWFYDRFMNNKPIRTQNREIAQFLVSRGRSGRLLDVGAGPGRLLLEIHRLAPDLELYGLDISPAMVRQARKNLEGVRADFREGTIQRTDYESGYFTVVTCTGSLYLWDYPVESLDEIFRILKAGHSACMFETYGDFNRDEFEKALSLNRLRLGSIQKRMAPLALRKQLSMTYKIPEFAQLIEKSRFAKSYAIGKLTLAGLPIWVSLTLSKPLQTTAPLSAKPA
jgi:ubiquinone/menaquinone biosynthesis C-methylase UbiE